MRTILAGLIVLVGAGAWAGEPMPEEQRADAHRTILRRLSQAAKTAELKLPEESEALIDLMLDLERNKADIRARKAPRSRFFMGTPHAIVEAKDGVFRYSADFVTSTIDAVEAPLAQIPGILRVALDAEVFARTRLPDEPEADWNGRRLGLIATLVTQAGKALAGDEATAAEWKSLRPELARSLAAELASVPRDGLFVVLSALTRVGGDAEAKILLERMKNLGDAPAYFESMYARAVCGMEGPVAGTYLRSCLSNEDARTRAMALGAIDGPWCEHVLELVVKALAETNESVWSAAVRALERMGSAEARKALADANAAAADDDPKKIHVGLALVRLGDDGPRAFLEKRLEALKGKTDGRSRFLASSIERALASGEEGR